MVMNLIEVAGHQLHVLAMTASKIKLGLAGDYICAFGFPSFDLVVSPETISNRSDPHRRLHLCFQISIF
jgi:hypothetical protein